MPCVFIRLTGCDLRCSYCDTAYAFTGGETIPMESILEQVDRLAEGYPEPPLVELTGGEPLLQKETPALLTALCDRGFTVLLETSGAHDISGWIPACIASWTSNAPAAVSAKKISPKTSPTSAPPTR